MKRNVETRRRKESARHAGTMTGERVLGRNRKDCSTFAEIAVVVALALIAFVGIEGLLQLAYMVQAARHGWSL